MLEFEVGEKSRFVLDQYYTELEALNNKRTLAIGMTTDYGTVPNALEEEYLD